MGTKWIRAWTRGRTPSPQKGPSGIASGRRNLLRAHLRDKQRWEVEDLCPRCLQPACWRQCIYQDWPGHQNPAPQKCVFW
eukprot:11161563-Lingulodinium_polyedra.AAC.1